MLCKNQAMHRIVVLALDGVIPFELSLVSRIFDSATGPSGEPLYEVVTCSLDGGPVQAMADFAIVVRHDASVLSTADTLIIPAAEALDAITGPADLPAGLADALALVRPGTRIASICIGSYVLAALGLLDGRPATTHWNHAGEFRRRFPSVWVTPDVLYVDDGDVLTSAGAASGLDLCLHLVRRDHGSKVANTVARRCVVPPWRDGGQAQYVERPVPERSGSSTAATRAWALERLHEPLQLADLAEHAGMSRRTFTRRFRDEVGSSPAQWLIQQRVELARHLLEDTDLPIDSVAARAGFGTGTSLRQHLHTALGVSPHTYRRTFQTV